MKALPIKCRIRAEASTTRVDVYDDIGGGGFFGGISASDFAGQMSKVKGALEVHINSGGGDVFDGITISNAIRAHKGPVTTIVDGIAASIASVIAQAGVDRVMQPGSMMMIHDAFGGCIGNAAEMAKMAATLDQVSNNLADIYAAHSGQSAEQWRDAMRAETWYTADEAVAAGLADRVGDGDAELPASLDLAAFSSVPGRIAAQLRTLPKAKAPKKPKAARKLRAKAMPVHHTATVDKPWDGPAAVAAMPADDTVLRYCHAWVSPEAAATPHKEGDDDADDQKSNYKFPHHSTKGGPANMAACRNGLARLASAKIPDADRAGVEAHLRAHLKDGGAGDDAGNHADTGFAAELQKALREVFK